MNQLQDNAAGNLAVDLTVDLSASLLPSNDEKVEDGMPTAAVPSIATTDVDAAAAIALSVDLTSNEEEDGKPAAEPVMIDLSDTVTDIERQNAEYVASMEKTLARSKKRQRTTHSRKEVASAPHPEDVVDLDAEMNKKMSASVSDGGNTAGTVDKDASYKQELGPIRMDFCSNFYPPHAFANQPQNPKLKTNKIFQELIEYKLNLPVQPHSSIFVRALESRVDLLRVVITGPADTPYSRGCFVFDVYLPDYPHAAPKVQFLTTGGGKVRFNPNLYNCGKVCLSLLGTWSGPGWIANKSTLLQVLISIQGLVLVSEPYFNEPGYQRTEPGAIKKSDKYNINLHRQTAQLAIRDMLFAALGKVVTDRQGENAQPAPNTHSTIPLTCYTKPMYPEFAQVFLRHFVHQAADVRTQLREWKLTRTNIARQVENLLQECEERSRQQKPAAVERPKPPPSEQQVIEIL